MLSRPGNHATPTLVSSGSHARTLLQTSGLPLEVLRLGPEQTIFRQGAAASDVYYLEAGRAKVCVTSATGKEATVFLAVAGDFLGEEAITTREQIRTSTVTTMTPCVVTVIKREKMIHAVHENSAILELLLGYLVMRNMRIQADVVDLLFNSTEKRLARTLLLMADASGVDQPVSLLPMMTQNTLAEIVGTSRSRVNIFMNRFRDLGFIEYKRRIRVHKAELRQILDA